MLSIDEINESIIELEQRDTTFANCERLAPLYIVREMLTRYKEPASTPLSLSGDTELMQAVNGKNPNAVWAVMSKVVEQVIKPIHPNIYARMLQEIKEID